MKNPLDFTAHFPRTHYDTLLSRSELVKRVREDLSAMESKGVPGAAEAQTFDEFPGFGSYLKFIKQGVKADAARTHLATFGRPINTTQLDEMFSIHPEWAKTVYSSAAEYLSLLNFEKAGKKMFYFASALVERLAETTLDAPAEYLRLPFDSCMFFIRSPITLDALYRLGGNEPPNRTAPISVFLSEHPFHNMRKIMIQVFHADDYRTYNLVKRELLINPKWTIERALKTDWTNLNRENPDWEGPATGYMGDTEDESAFFEDGLHFFRIIINAVLYLASSDPDISFRSSPVADILAKAKATLNGYKRHALEQEAQSYSRLDGTVVGENLRAIVVGNLTGTHQPGLSTSGILLDRRFIVRGHWRNQAHGEGMQLRKLIWIQPYWKGPEMADMVNKPYVVR